MKYTVVLMKPMTLMQAADETPAESIYVAVGIEAESRGQALLLARAEAFKAVTDEWGNRAIRRFEISPSDFELVVMFEGECKPCAFAGNLGMR